ncbi:MAG: hypothetical protein Q4P28_00810, partial [Tissierellia bacterium]|nr:hypothetical protein [Tissierellia bacterium]
ITRSYSLEEYTDNVHHIRRIAYYLLERIDIPKPVRLLGLTMANLTENRYRQLEFLQRNIYKNDRKPSR